MRLLNFSNFEMPAVFAKLVPRGQPPQKTLETRRVSDALSHPQFAFFDPNALHYPDHTLPVNPGNGGYVTCGAGMVTYNHQATWDRSRVDLAGPVREFFRSTMWDNRVKHL